METLLIKNSLKLTLAFLGGAESVSHAFIQAKVEWPFAGLF